MPQLIPDMLIEDQFSCTERLVKMDTVETKLTISVDWCDFYVKQILNKHAGGFDEIARLTDTLPLFDLMHFDFSTVIWP